MSIRSRVAAAVRRRRRNWAIAQYESGKALEKAGSWPEAAAAFQKAVDADPRRAEWHFRQGRAWHKAGNIFGAVTAYQQALARDPDHPEWHFRLGKAYLSMRNYQSAAYCFRQADK